MRRILVIAAVVGLLLAGCGRDPVGTARAAETASSIGAAQIPVGERAALPPISGTALDGSSMSLDAAKGRIAVVNMWASWCPPCRDEIPLLVDAYRATDRDEVAFVGLNVNDDPAAAEQFATEAGIPYPSIVDADGSLMASIPSLPSQGLPSTVVLDRQGRVAARVIGPVRAGQVESIVEALRAEG